MFIYEMCLCKTGIFEFMKWKNKFQEVEFAFIFTHTPLLHVNTCSKSLERFCTERIVSMTTILGQ